MPKDPKKIMFMMTILCIVIGLAAIAVGVVAMLLVAAWQILNYRQWKKSLK